MVSEKSKRDLQEFELNMVDGYRDFKHELLSWLANYGKSHEKHGGVARSTLEPTDYKLETVFRWLWRYENQYTTQIHDRPWGQVRALDQSDGMINSTVLHHIEDSVTVPSAAVVLPHTHFGELRRKTGSSGGRNRR